MLQAPQVLQSSPFNRLSPPELELIEQHRAQRHYAQGEWIVHYGDIWPYLLMVESGQVTALKESAEGRSLIVANIMPGEIFWGLAFFNEDLPMWVGLCAHEETTLSLWRRSDVLPILRSNGEFTWELARKLVGRMQRASDIVEELAFQPVTGRLAHLLLDHFGDSQQEFVERDLTLDEMAALIGTTREMVCRQLYRFAGSGLVQINRTEFKIVDVEGLQALAKKSKG